MCAPSRNSVFYQDFLQLAERANPEGMIWVVTDNLSSHDSKSTRAWLEDHPRIRHAFIPKRACWLNMQEGWWRIFRRQALAGQDFADSDEIALATRVATAQLNARAQFQESAGPSGSVAGTSKRVEHGALVLEPPRTCTMNLQECAHTLDPSHRL